MYIYRQCHNSPRLASKQAHKLLTHKLFCWPSTPVCKTKIEPGFVPGTNWGFTVLKEEDVGLSHGQTGVCPGMTPGSSQGQPDQNVYVHVPFSCLIDTLLSANFGT